MDYTKRGFASADITERVVDFPLRVISLEPQTLADATLEIQDFRWRFADSLAESAPVISCGPTDWAEVFSEFRAVETKICSDVELASTYLRRPSELLPEVSSGIVGQLKDSIEYAIDFAGQVDVFSKSLADRGGGPGATPQLWHHCTPQDHHNSDDPLFLFGSIDQMEDLGSLSWVDFWTWRQPDLSPTSTARQVLSGIAQFIGRAVSLLALLGRSVTNLTLRLLVGDLHYSWIVAAGTDGYIPYLTWPRPPTSLGTIG